MLGLAAIPALLQLIGFWFMPESPRWLIRHGENDRALKALKRMRANDEIAEREFSAIYHNFHQVYNNIQKRIQNIQKMCTFTKCVQNTQNVYKIYQKSI